MHYLHFWTRCVCNEFNEFNGIYGSKKVNTTNKVAFELIISFGVRKFPKKKRLEGKDETAVLIIILSDNPILISY